MCSSCVSTIEKYGADPAHIQWTVVRGDTATLKVEFLENDESTFYDTEDWAYKATAYDSTGDVLDNLNVEGGDGYVIITIPPNTSVNWGNAYRRVVSELPFDVQVYIPTDCGSTTWTPVIGTICVLGDVSPGGSL